MFAINLRPTWPLLRRQLILSGAHVGTATDTNRGWRVAQTGSLLCRGLAIDWQSAHLPNTIRRNPDSESGPVCATVAVPRCALMRSSA